MIQQADMLDVGAHEPNLASNAANYVTAQLACCPWQVPSMLLEVSL